MDDYRSEKMETREGKGVARRAWGAYARRVNAAVLPLIEPAVRRFSVNKAADLVGFWVLWHLHGGFEGLQRIGFSERTIYRQVKWFRMAYGEHPDAYVMPGVKLDPEAYIAAGSARKKPRG
jgi:hypothetical protein